MSPAHVLEVRNVSRAFQEKLALDEASLSVAAGEVHALLGPNGAGKTTLLRILAGLVKPTSGSVVVLGQDATMGSRPLRGHVGLVPSGDRAFYLRITGLENLAFFGRLHGMCKRAAIARAHEVLAAVGLEDAARMRVGHYSHGMQKRLAVARALLAEPPVLLVDEATHDLDPTGSRIVRDLVSAFAERGTAVLWATQRLEEIRGFADRVTLLDHGRAKFVGTVPELLDHASPRSYLLRLQNGSASGERLEAAVQEALAGIGRVTAGTDGDAGHFLVTLSDQVVLGEAVVALAGHQIQVLTCRDEHSEVEEAFFSLTGNGDR